jgi:hypothetical protein
MGRYRVRTVRRHVRLAALAAFGLSVSVLPVGGVTAGATGVNTTITVVASGLNAPRGITYDADGHRLLAAEAGVWFLGDGSQPCAPAERNLPFCLDHSGSVFQYDLNSQAGSRIVTGLPSASIQFDFLPGVVIGLHDVTMKPGDDKIYAVFGTLGNKPYRTALGPGAALLGQAVTINGTGKVTPYADLLSFIDTRYPVPPPAPAMEADPYGVVVGPFGTMVANAGGRVVNGVSMGNDLLKVTPSGTISEVAQFPAHPLIGDPSITVNTVPTSVAQGPDGAFYVGELSGGAAWDFPGEARIWRVVPGQAPAIYATGFHTIIDLKFDSQGRMLVLQTSTDPFNVAGEGELLRLEPNGSRTVIFGAGDGVLNPGGVALVGDDTYYVTTKITGTSDNQGQLLRVQVTG